MKTLVRCIVFLAILLVHRNIASCQQSDTSSYFPLGAWGIWIDHGVPPYSGTMNTNIEYANWLNLNGNYLVYWIPYWVEGTIMDFADQNGYKMDVANFNYWHPYGSMNTNSLYYWINSIGMTDTVTAINIIDTLRGRYPNRTGFYNYTFDQERPVYDTAFWPRVQFLARKIHEMDAGHKSVMVSGDAPSRGFVNATPSLDVLQVDIYKFLSDVPTSYSGQQQALDDFLTQCDSTLQRLKGTQTEWQVVMQSQHEALVDGRIFRRPNLYELRAQASLALTRGARGVISYSYGTVPPNDQRGTGTQSVRTYERGLLHGASVDSAATASLYGLVDQDRAPYTAATDPGGQDAFANVANVYADLKAIGPTIRKLKHYQAFPGWNVPANNSAGIVSVSHNYIGDNRIEIGTFKRMDQGTDSTNYFMLVNRVCNTITGDTAAPQTASVVVGGGRYFIQDQRTKDITIGTYDQGMNNSTFSITLGRGEGKLFLLKPTREGTISSSETWRNAEVVTSTVTVNSGVTLTVEPGTIVKFQSSTSLTVNGTLNAQAPSSNPVTFDRVATSGDWLGIKYQSGSSGTLDNAMIQFAKKGVYVASSSPTIQNCTIQNFTEQGIYVLNGNPKIYTNTINGWNGSSQVGTGIYVDNSGLGSSTLEIANSNVIKGCVVGIDALAPIYKLEHNTLGTSGTYSDASSNAYGINFTGVGTVTNNKVYGNNNDSWGISLQANTGNKTTTYNLLDHHYIGLIDNGFQDGSISYNSFTNDQISFANSDGWMSTQQNNFWDSGVTTYNILNSTLYDPDMTDNYLESYTVAGDEKIYDVNQGLRWYPPAGSPFAVGPTWKLSSPPDSKLPGAKIASEAAVSQCSLSAYPNPFNPTTTVTFELPEPSFISLILYDLLGRQIKILAEANRVQGRYSIVWDGSDSKGSCLSSGVYLLRMRAGNTTLTHKLVLTK